MRWLRRFRPKRLAGQMIALLLLALVLAQIVTLLIFADERRFAIRAADRAQLLGRAVSVFRLLEDSSPSMHRQILETASERRIRYWLSADSPVDRDDDHGHQDAAIRERLADLLDKDADRDVRILLGEDEGSWRHWLAGDRRPVHGRERHGRSGNGHRWSLNVLISMQLDDGNWLNLESRLRPPNSGWNLQALTWLGLMGIALSAVVIIMVRRITRPMAALASAAERAGRGEVIDPLPEVGPIDVRQATTAFNRMHRRLQRFVRDRTEMLAAMSHDLRTPITTLRLRAEFIDDEETKGKILETLEDMQRMAEAALAFVREEVSVEPTRTVDLAALTESVVVDFADLGHDVTFDHVDRCTYACRPAGLKRALRNLLENGIRYGERADVRLVREDDRYVIVIDDEGPGIPEAEIERMFKPFERLDLSRNEATGGIGLGLAIARSIVRGHGGDIVLANRERGGLSARIALPDRAGDGDDPAGS